MSRSNIKINKLNFIVAVLLLNSIFYTKARAEDLNIQSPFGVLEFLHWSHPWNNGIDYFGLVRWDFSRKPAFKSYRECFRN